MCTLYRDGQEEEAHGNEEKVGEEEHDDENVDVEEDRCRVKRLETLSGKFGFMKQALDQLKNRCVEE